MNSNFANNPFYRLPRDTKERELRGNVWDLYYWADVPIGECITYFTPCKRNVSPPRIKNAKKTTHFPFDFCSRKTI